MTSPFYTSMPPIQLEPSFFELIMSDRLNRSLLPAFRRLIQVLSSRLSNTTSSNRVGLLLLNVLSNYLDEVETLLLGYIQFKSLSQNDALLTERIYNIKRTTVENLTDNVYRTLSSREKLLTLCVEVFLPYLKRKLESAYASATTDRTNVPSSGTSFGDKFPLYSKLIIWCFPLLHGTYEGASLLAQLCFLVGISKNFYPSQHSLALNQVYVRATFPQESHAQIAVEESRRSSQQNNIVTNHNDSITINGNIQTIKPTGDSIYSNGSQPRRDNNGSCGSNTFSLRETLTSSKFLYMQRCVIAVAVVGALYQSISWWNSSRSTNSQKEGNCTKVDDEEEDLNKIPPPPPPLALSSPSAASSQQLSKMDGSTLAKNTHEQDTLQPIHMQPKTILLPLDQTLCPLCIQPRINPAASSSGCVFCYKCITDFVNEHKVCPVTQLPCVASQVRRIFDD